MADAVARQRYADETRPVTVKQRVQEESGTHPGRVEATCEIGEAMVTRFDGDSDHGGADLVDDGVPATAVAKRPNKSGLSTTASRRSCRDHKQGQQLTGWCWPR